MVFKDVKLAKGIYEDFTEKMQYKRCDCGCEVSVKYPCYRTDGTCFVKCPLCGKTIEVNRGKI